MPDKLLEEQNSSWHSWKIYVIKSLEKLEKRQTDNEKDFQTFKSAQEKDTIELKTKVGLTSGIISVVVSLIMSIIAGLIISSVSNHIILNHKDSNEINISDVEIPEKTESK